LSLLERCENLLVNDCREKMTDTMEPSTPQFPWSHDEPTPISTPKWGSVTIPASMSELQAFSDNLDILPPAIILAAWSLLLRSYVGTDNDTYFGYRMDGIWGKHEKPASGAGFGRTLVLHSRHRNDDVIEDILRTAHSQFTGALLHQSPLDSNTEQFAQIFNSQVLLGSATNNTPLTIDDLNRLSTETGRQDDVVLDTRDSNTGEFSLWYRSSKLPESQIISVARTFANICTVLTRDVRLRLRDIDILSQFDHETFASTPKGLQADSLGSSPMVHRTGDSVQYSPESAPPHIERRDSQGVHSPPMIPETPVKAITEHELQLQILWARVLKISQTDIHTDSNFLKFGDSIAAMKLVSAARRKGYSLTVAGIFESPVLSDMASRMKSRSPSSSAARAEAPQPFSMVTDSIEIRENAAMQCKCSIEAIEDIYPCSPLQEGLMAASLKQLGTYVAQDVLYLKASTDLVRFKLAWQSVFKHNAILRSRLLQQESGMVQAVMKESIAWLTGDDLESYLRADKETHMHLGDKLTRFGLIESEKAPILVLTRHHSTYDGFSIP
jgi:aryl carrier-like protein